jgi:hypothetical protein
MGYMAGFGIVHISTCLVQGLKGRALRAWTLAGNACVIHTVRYTRLYYFLPAFNSTKSMPLEQA